MFRFQNVINWQQYDVLVNDMASQIFVKQRAEQISFDCVAGLPRGGLVPAVHLSHLLGIPYIDTTQLAALQGIRCLLVDDYFHSGETLYRSLSALPPRFNVARDVRFVCLCRNETSARKITKQMFPLIESNLPESFEMSPWIVMRETAHGASHLPWEIRTTGGC